MSEDDPCVLSLYQLPIAADYNSSARARLVLPARWPPSIRYPADANQAQTISTGCGA